jgi:hypothetical protein
MKKAIIASILLCLATASFATGLDFLQNGEYAIYSDTRGGSAFLRGYWFGRIEDGSHYVVLSINRNLESGQQVNYFVEFTDGEDGLPRIVKVDGLNDKTPPEFKQGLVDFMNYVTLYLRHRDEIGFGTVIEDPWEDYSLEFTFNRLLPFFRFSGIRVKGQDEDGYVLNSAGVCQVSGLKGLLKTGLTKVVEKDRKLGDLAIAPASPVQVTMNGLTTSLDGRWVYNDSLGSPGYWLPLHSVRDSQITVERLPEAGSPGGNLPTEEVCRLCIVATTGVDYRSIFAKEGDGRLYVAYTTYDDNGVKNYQVFIVRQVGGARLAINFSTFADIFDRNPEYYQKILSGLEGE